MHPGAPETPEYCADVLGLRDRGTPLHRDGRLANGHVQKSRLWRAVPGAAGAEAVQGGLRSCGIRARVQRHTPRHQAGQRAADVRGPPGHAREAGRLRDLPRRCRAARVRDVLRDPQLRRPRGREADGAENVGVRHRRRPGRGEVPGSWRCARRTPRGRLRGLRQALRRVGLGGATLRDAHQETAVRRRERRVRAAPGHTHGQVAVRRAGVEVRVVLGEGAGERAADGRPRGAAIRPGSAGQPLAPRRGRRRLRPKASWLCSAAPVAALWAPRCSDCDPGPLRHRRLCHRG
mmetsp:Transcript_90800/g.236538  ORF Transcript_90800/g.236538 Transcript_90800/m.236538 type:complete len:291 (+) Transcript_90800:175-1047(+)